MRILRLSLGVLAVATFLGCSDAEDASQPVGTDTGMLVDTAVTPMDTNTTPMDTNTTPMDTNTTPMDTSVTDTAPMPTKHTVNVGTAAGANTFAPAALTIKVGDTVEFVWLGNAHTVTEANGTGCVVKTGGFDSGLRNAGGASFTPPAFTTAGTINYICTPHCALGMKGTITVTP